MTVWRPSAPGCDPGNHTGPVKNRLYPILRELTEKLGKVDLRGLILYTVVTVESHISLKQFFSRKVTLVVFYIPP